MEISSDELAQHSTAGWPRALYVEAVTSRLSRGAGTLDESGVQFGGMLETPGYGALSVDATLRLSSDVEDGSGNMVTIVQRGMPMSSDWRMNSTVGVTYSPTSDLARSQARFFVPGIQITGTALEWRRHDEVQVFASYGEPAVYSGYYIPTVENLGGRQVGAGMQWNVSDRWSLAAQATDVAGVRNTLGGTSSEIDVESSFGAAAWDDGRTRAQLNLAASSRDSGDQSVGAWVDARLRAGRVTHSFGAFHLDPDLAWGNQQLASDAEGGYYRAGYSSRRWSLDGGLDYVSSVSGLNGDVLYGTGYARYQQSSRIGFGGGASVRHVLTDPDGITAAEETAANDWGGAWSTFGFVDAANRWGTGRVQGSYSRDDLQDNAQVAFDQTWNTDVGHRLSTSLFLGRANLPERNETNAGLALYGGGAFRGNLSLDGNVRWATALTDGGTTDVFANLGMHWGFAPGWRASATYYRNQSDGRLPLVVDSPVTVDPVYQRIDRDDSGVYLALRYDWRAGSPRAPLGGAPGAGAGRVRGLLFLDANDNGRYDAGELGASNVVVMLNGRYAVRTDGSGRFDFPAVVAGNHYLTVVPDNLPLAWSLPLDARFDVRVGVRGETRVDLPARKQR